MEPIWKKHWPASVDERSIRLPEETLPAVLEQQARRVPDRAAIVFYGREVTFAELHDSVSQLVFSITLIAQAIAPAWKRDPAEGEQRVGRVLELCQSALFEMRSFLADLRPAAEVKQGHSTLHENRDGDQREVDDVVDHARQ